MDNLSNKFENDYLNREKENKNNKNKTDRKRKNTL